MKKSTLITTIAMIVVVVVALSTATYAWFSSSATTQTTQNITTVGQSGITVLTNSTMFQGTFTDSVSSQTAAFDGTTLLPKTFNDSQETTTNGLRAGLWAPVKEIAAATTSNKNAIYPTSNSSTDCKVGGDSLVSFISGTQNNAGTIFEIETPSTAMSPDLVRITNNTSGDLSHLYLNIYVSAKNNENSYFAAQGVSFAIIKYTSSSAGTLKANTQYSYLKHDAALDTDDNGTSGVGDAHDTYSISADFGKVALETGFTSTFNHRPTTTTPGQGWSTNTVAGMAEADELIKAQLVSGGAYYVMSIDLDALAQGASTNILLYAWLDGGYLTDSASKAEIKIVYSFANATVSEVRGA